MTKLTEAQKNMLKLAPRDWGRLNHDMRPVNALWKRGLVTVEYRPHSSREPAYLAAFWQLTDSGARLVRALGETEPNG